MSQWPYAAEKQTTPPLNNVVGGQPLQASPSTAASSAMLTKAPAWSIEDGSLQGYENIQQTIRLGSFPTIGWLRETQCHETQPGAPIEQVTWLPCD